MKTEYNIKTGAEIALLMMTRYKQKQGPKHPKAYTKKDRKSNKIKF